MYRRWPRGGQLMSCTCDSWPSTSSRGWRANEKSHCTEPVSVRWTAEGEIIILFTLLANLQMGGQCLSDLFCFVDSKDSWIPHWPCLWNSEPHLNVQNLSCACVCVPSHCTHYATNLPVDLKAEEATYFQMEAPLQMMLVKAVVSWLVLIASWCWLLKRLVWRALMSPEVPGNVTDDMSK